MHHDWTQSGSTSISVLSSKKDQDCSGGSFPGHDAQVAIQIHTGDGFHISFSLTPDNAKDLAERLATAALHATTNDAEIIDFTLNAEAA